MSNTDLLSGESVSGASTSTAVDPAVTTAQTTAETSAKNEALVKNTAEQARPQAAQSHVTQPQATQTDGTQSNGTSAAKRKGLSAMLLPELRQLAGELGISGTTGMRKGDLIAAIRERQGQRAGGANAAEQLPLGGAESTTSESTVSGPTTRQAPVSEQTAQPPARNDGAQRQEPAARHNDAAGESNARTRRRRAGRPAGSPDAGHNATASSSSQSSSAPSSSADAGRTENSRGENSRSENSGSDSPRADNSRRDDARSDERQADRQSGQQTRPAQQDSSQQGRQGNNATNGNNGRQSFDDDDDGGRRRNRRYRDRRRGGRGGSSGGGRGDNETEVREDDVLLPVAGILDVLENYAFVRTSGYLPGPNDVYVSLSLVRKHGLRRGDAITGAIRQPREGEQQRQKFNPLVRVDTVNGLDPEQARKRPEFTKLTPLYPNERLRLETEPHKLTTRVIDLIMPVGKGQRALIVSPPKAGKTTILQDIANAISTNNPECYLMVVLVDERPEEVTDMQRSVKGEVVASTFDRPPSDHTTVAELSIERAKRLVEMGNDVVVLLDSITRLGRAYNLAAPASGRILSGGVDSTALYPPKRFLGAARNIEHGGSLTIFATSIVESGSTMDTVIFEEFKGTGNAELKLDRKIAERRVFPAVDINPSGTRKDELLLSPDELAIHVKLQRVLNALEPQQAIDLLLTQLRKSKTNIEFLMQVANNTPGKGIDD